MNPLHLPENGSVLIIDENPNEALPIIEVLSKHGIAATYYSGINEKQFPQESVQQIRLIFLDLQLLETITDAVETARFLVSKLKVLVSPTNGPYILVLWSKNQDKFGGALEEEINRPEHSIRPSCIVRFKKRDCLEQKTSEPVPIKELVEDLQSHLKHALDESQLALVEKVVAAELEGRLATDWVAKGDAFEIIQKNLEKELEAAGCFHLFIIWQNLVNRASGKIIQEMSLVLDPNENWEKNARNLMYRMGKSRVNQSEVDEARIRTEAIRTLNGALEDALDNANKALDIPEHVKVGGSSLYTETTRDGTYELTSEATGLFLKKNGTAIAGPKELSKAAQLLTGLKAPDDAHCKALWVRYDADIPARINTRLHLELEPSEDLLPGNVYEIIVDAAKKERYLTSYFKKGFAGQATDYRFIELEVSPVCDYAQDKWQKARLLPGILFPGTLIKDLPNAQNLYVVEPEFIIDNVRWKMIFNHFLFKSIDFDALKQHGKPVLRLKRELHLDIVSRLAAQVNRPGIMFVA